MELLLARTNSEAHLHMDLHPCRCGDTTRPRDSAVLTIDGVLASRYTGTCPSCGMPREFLFRLPEEFIVVPPGAVVLGDGTPSELLDPGEWLLVADRFAATAPADPALLDDEGVLWARRAVGFAEAAVGEVLAFVPPGADAVPPEAFRTDLGRAMWAAEPGRFSRRRLDAVRGAYREMLDELAEA